MLLLFLLILLMPAVASALTVTVVDDAGQPVSDYRWILQEDISHPGIPYLQTNNTVSIVTHRSDSRILASGHATSSTWPIRVAKYTLPNLVPDGTILPTGISGNPNPYNDSRYDADPDLTGRYIIQVMASGYSMGGQLIAAGQTSVRVVMNRNPLPTTQFSILVFNDNKPLNNEPDAEEDGLPGFRISMSDNLGGPITQDAFGMPIGTVYATNADGSFIPDPTTHYKVAKMGDGYVYTDKDGKALIQNMWNGIFGIQAIPPTGENWRGAHASMKGGGYAWQDNTIEGTPFIDVWGEANGARVFIEGWGAGFYHVFFGFVDPDKLPGAAPAPTSTIKGVTVKGRLVDNHYGRPPRTAVIAAGPPVTDGWIALNIADPAVEGAPPVEGVDRALLPANRAALAMACDPETGEFVINNVAPGNYQLVSWDRPLDYIFNAVDLAVPIGGDNGTGIHDMGDVLMVRWFGSMQGSVFYDANGNGFPDPGEQFIPSVKLNLRFRDGSFYQQTQTLSDGTYKFTEMFPFFKWLVGEVDNSRWKASGITAVVDDGGIIPPDQGWNMPSGDINDPSLGVRNPQIQYAINSDGSPNINAPISNPNTGAPTSRTQVTTNVAEPILTQAIINFNGQYDRLDWGKQAWGPGQNGGISGVVSYNNTRAESDPRYAVQELWDVGVARAQVVLYAYETNYAALAAAHAAGKPTVYEDPYDINMWKIKIQRRGATTPRLADVDNYPYGWATGGKRGPEDIDRDDPSHLLPDAGRVFNPGDAIQITHTDSWDDEVAKNIDPAHPDAGGWPVGTVQPNPPVIQGRKVIGSDNFATWEQIRPGVFDGAYVINSYYPGGIASGSAERDFLPPADYVVQVVPPPGHVIQTEESRNIVTGDSYQPGRLDLPPELVGDFHLVPPILDLFPDQQWPADFANQWRPLADRKLVTVSEGRNFICNFNVYSVVPKCAHVVGFVLQDLSAEFNPNNPIYGERDGAAWIPVSIRDWAGHEIARTYSDEFGCYDTMVVSTYNADVPCPSGYAPTITTIILNDPSMPDPANPNGPRIPDPYWNPAIGTAPVPLEYYPGKVNYADTPVVPIGAFQGGPNGQLDVEPRTGTPVIKTVAGTPIGTNAGPYIGNLSDVVTLTSLGPTQVLDPNYRIHGSASSTTIVRDFGFGSTAGTVMLYHTQRVPNDLGTPATIVTWTDSTITFRVPNPLPTGSGDPTSTGGTEWQLMVTRANGNTTPIGITLTYEPNPAHVHMVIPPVQTAPIGSIQPAGLPNTAIQDQVDAAAPGDLVIVPVNPYPWNEYIVMYKPIRLQGSGVGTVINGVPDPQSRVPAWHNKITSLLGGDDPFVINECPGVEVIGETNTLVQVPPTANPGDTMVLTGFNTIPSRIDGFLFKAAIHGGGINVYNEGSNIRISNNRIKGNMGDTFNGGISIGAPAGGGVEGGTFGEDPGAQTSYNNTNVVIEFNQVFMNSSLDGGGGIGINTGASFYKIRDNWIMGNFCFDAPGAAAAISGAGNGGGGILHMGLCPGGLIANNVIAYNEVYFGFSTGGGDGGGICIQGESDGGSPTGTSGTGSVVITGNLIMGNLSGAGLGGGIRLAGVNGPEILDTNNIPVFEGNAPGAFPDDFIGLPSADPSQWYEIGIYNNMIVNNEAGYSGGGISIQDAIKVKIINNTIANNDACAVALNTFPPNRGRSVPQGAGIVTFPNTAALPPVADLPAAYKFPFSNPILSNNIIWHNRSYLFDYAFVGQGLNNPTNHMPVDNTSGGLIPDPAGVVGPTGNYVDLYVVGGGSMTPQNCILSTSSRTPSFVSPFINSNYTALVYDEGGNNSISLRFDPISVYTPFGAPRGDYHLTAPLRPGANVSSTTALQTDYDGQVRPGTRVDIGADQFYGNAPGQYLPGTGNEDLVVYPGGLLPNPNNNPYAPTPPPVAGEPPHLAENEPLPEVNPLIPPGPQKPPTVLNPVWMTAPPTGRSFEGQFTYADVQNWYNFTTRLQGFDPYDTLGNLALVTPSISNDPVGQYVFNNLSGNWPDAPLADGEEPPAPRFDTKNMLALWNYGWVKYTQPSYYAPSDDVMYGLLLADLNKIIQSGAGLYNAMRPGGIWVSNYVPSERTVTLASQSPLNTTLLNRSIIQDSFYEVRRWYDPAVAYSYLVCGDGFAEMADGTELYIFGFSDQTPTANNPTDDPNLGPDKVMLNAHASATLSAPTLVVQQDQTFHLDLGNVGFAGRPDLFDPHTIHFHGFPNAAPIFDGMPLASMAVHEGATIPYFYKLQIEGTYFYHCHVEATEHMQQGMIGNLYVLARQNNLTVGTPLAHLPAGKGTTHQAGYKYAYNDGDGSTEYDVEYPIQVTGLDHYFHDQEMAIQPPAFATLFDTYPVLNGRGYPDTINTGVLSNSLTKACQTVNSLITARKGQRILIRYSNVSETEFDTLTVPGIPMTVVGKDARLLRGPDGKNLYYRTTSVTLGGGETADFILDTANTQPGTYFLYTARLNQLSNDQEDYGGMLTHIVITQ